MELEPERSLEQEWEPVSGAVGAEFARWRQAHPRATLTAIEAALDASWRRVRAQLVQAAAEPSAARDLKTASAPVACPACGEALAERTWERRELTTWGDQAVVLERSLCSPHSETAELVEDDFYELVASLPEEDAAGPVDIQAGTEVR